MKARAFGLYIIMLGLAAVSGFGTLYAQTGGRQFYQLKTYTFSTLEQEKLTDYYMEEAYLPALKRNGVNNVGVFKRHRNEKDTLRQLFVLFPLSSLNQVVVLDKALQEDKLHEKVGAPFLKAPHDMPPYLRVESTLMVAFPKMPLMRPTPFTGPREERVYELRSYESPTDYLFRNKVEMFNAGGEVSLFERLGFNAVFYAEVLSGAHMPNLMYMTTFDSQETRDELWQQFFNSDTWKSLEKDPKYQNNVNHADIMLLYPTSYSDY
jgi:hypothetical protein